MATDWMGFGYAALLVSGGIVGFIKAGSAASLVAGLVFGVLAGVGAYLTSKNAQRVWVSLGVSGAMAVVMGTRFLSTWKFMPAGLMALTSVLMVGKIVVGMATRPHQT
ncbi:Transmembrane protein 14C [Merluccius polli]|uniref:Transmembrane protein 14C n=1 Tax=Merluccius polli TaxID=89951 RepID=A0AA47M6M1_MERPO|nr:Transmembrane protein 14C [Merluccius polli]